MFATGPRAVGFTIVWPEGVIFSSMMTYHVQFLLLVLTGWVNRQQQDVIDYLQEENRVLRAGLRGKRLRLSDDDRRRCRRYPTKFNSGRDIPRAFPTCVSYATVRLLDQVACGPTSGRLPNARPPPGRK